MNSLILAFTLIASSNSFIPPPPNLAGWYDVFPRLDRFNSRAYSSPVVDKNKDGQPTYSQTLHYDAVTGLVRSFNFTITRDPAIKTRYSAETMKALNDPPTATKVAGYQAWTWMDGRAVIVLDDDKAIVITPDPMSVASFPTGQTDKATFDRIAAALKDPPRTDFTPTLDTFRAVKKGSSVQAMQEWCGHAKEVTPRADGGQLWIFPLADGSRVVVGTGKQAEFVHHETKEGKVVELVK